jgi:hypothetical protein
MTDEELMTQTFDLLMESYGYRNYVVFSERWGFVQILGYHDGGWLEGYDVRPVIYWGA